MNFNCIVEWYNSHKRDLPFRKTHDPYYIWISEIMAQQTQIVTMLPYYDNWMKKWPTIKELYEADETDVLKAWEGLGYYSRCRKIMECAKVIVEQYDGIFPDAYEAILALPGIGPYTAGAISSIAFKLKEPAVDGNAIRVFSRVLCADTSSNSDIVYQTIKESYGELDPSQVNQGIMEIGALICLKTPKCEQCPLNSACLSYKNKCWDKYPIKKEAKPKKEIECYTYWIENDRGEVMITRFAKDNLMKGYYRLPQFAEDKHIGSYEGKRKHVFSHLIWNMNCYSDKGNECFEHCMFVSKDKLNDYAFIGAHRKIIEEKLNEQN